MTLCLSTKVIHNFNILISLICNFNDECESDQHLKYVSVLRNFVVIKLPEDGTLVPKHVGAGTYDELCFMIRVLFYFTLCFLADILNISIL